MPLDLHDTIIALASPPGPAERGIVRISGDAMMHSVRQIFVDAESSRDWTQIRRATRLRGHLELPALGLPLPAALMLWPTARSYTGQPMAEIHTIGSPPLLDAVLERLLECDARHASRGEFTMRAFLAGRIDLVQAEAVLGVIDAADHTQLEAALTQLGGGVTTSLTKLRQELLALLGDLEAGLDFVEEDIEFISSQQIVSRLSACQSELRRLADDAAHKLPSGYRQRIVLAGLPNAGKSTLFNRLLGTQKAIVSPLPGTTRDYLTATFALGGTEVELIDTAGWEAAASLVMHAAQQLRSEQTAAGDLVLWCSAADLSAEDRKADRRLREQLTQQSAQVLDIVTRGDLAENRTVCRDQPFHVSGMTGAGIDRLLATLKAELQGSRSARTELVSSTAVRCRDSLNRTTEAVAAAIRAAEDGRGDEIVALELRDAMHQIATILGEVYTDDVLDHIFSHFCIGK